MTKPTQPAGLSFDDVMARKRPTRKSLFVALETEPVDAFVDAENAHGIAKERADMMPEDRSARVALLEATEALEEAREALQARSVHFVFESLGRTAWEALVDDHPPTGEQKATAKKEGRPEPRWNEDSFPPVIVAATCVEPKMTEGQVKELFASEVWNDAEVMALIFAAVEVNQTRRVVDLGKEFALTLG